MNITIKELNSYSEYAKKNIIDERDFRATLRGFGHTKVSTETINKFIRDRNVADLINKLYHKYSSGIIKVSYSEEELKRIS